MRLSGRDLSCVRAGRLVFRDVSFSLPAGEALVLTGRNGAGKTSLLRLVAGLLRAESGSLALEGGAAERTIGEQCHFIAHQPALKPALTAAENLGFWTDWFDGAGDPAAALGRAGLGGLDDLPARLLSAGQQRRLALARLMTAERPLWLLDEPLNALDADGVKLLEGLVGSHLAGGGMVIAATHAALGFDARRLELAAA